MIERFESHNGKKCVVCIDVVAIIEECHISKSSLFQRTRNLGENGSRHYLMKEDNLRIKNNFGFAVNASIVNLSNLRRGKTNLSTNNF